MNIATLEFCQSIHKDFTAEDYNRTAWEASKTINDATTGIDGVKKLSVAFPVDDDDAEAVKRCFADVAYTLTKINRAADSIADAEGVKVGVNGLVTPGIVSSVSSGGESITYASAGSIEHTAERKAATDRAYKSQVIYGVIKSYLSGVTDANGVNLLYMGRYPYERLKHV